MKSGLIDLYWNLKKETITYGSSAASGEGGGRARTFLSLRSRLGDRFMRKEMGK